MRSGRLGLLLFSFLFLASSAWAQQTPTVNPQGLTVLKQAYSALVGSTSLTDATLTGTARRIAGSDDESGNVVLKSLTTGEARMDFSFPSGQRSEARVNTVKGPAGTWTGPDGKAHTLSQHNLLTDSSWFFPALTFSKLLTSQNSVVTLADQETRDGVAVTHLAAIQQFPDAPAAMAAQMQHLTQMEIFLNSSTLLPVALAFNQHPDNDARLDMPAEIRFSDYRAVNGVQVPFHVQRYLNNTLILDMQLQSVTLNSGLTASAFSIQ